MTNPFKLSYNKSHLWNLLILQSQEDIDACCQRWFYGGKLLGDKMQVEEAHIQPGYVVQVIVNTEHYRHGVNS